MRAVLCGRFGEPAEVLAAATVPDPQPGPGEILVRVTARTINPSDLLTVRGVYSRHTTLPLIPGFEAVGVVTAVGPDADPAWIRRRVLPLKGSGTWAEHVTSPAAWAVPVPDGVDDEAAVQSYINPISVDRMLSVDSGLEPPIPPPPTLSSGGRGPVDRLGPVVVANAAASACGRIAAQTCRDRGDRLVALVRRPEPVAELLALGAAAVVNVAVDDPGPVVMGLTGGAGAALGLDAIGGAAGADLVRLLAPGARLLSYGLLSGTLLRPDIAEAQARGVDVRGFWLRPWTESVTPADWQAAFAAVFGRIMAGTLVLPVAARFPLDDVAAAVRAAEAPGRRGKVLLVG